jgi:hypothetical protein
VNETIATRGPPARKRTSGDMLLMSSCVFLPSVAHSFICISAAHSSISCRSVPIGAKFLRELCATWATDANYFTGSNDIKKVHIRAHTDSRKHEYCRNIALSARSSSLSQLQQPPMQVHPCHFASSVCAPAEALRFFILSYSTL